MCGVSFRSCNWLQKRYEIEKASYIKQNHPVTIVIMKSAVTNN